jgi:hypothetical protein
VKSGRYGEQIAGMNAEYQATTGTEPSGFICPVCLRDVDVDRVTQAHAPLVPQPPCI